MSALSNLVPRSGVSRRHLLQAATVVGAVALIKVVTAELADHGVIRAATPWPDVLLGAITGVTYGLLAAGLVLVFRTNRIINFAHGQIGVLGATFFVLADVKWHFPYWVAFPFALAVSAAAGAVTETAAVRRLRNAPRLMSIVVTLGIGQFVLLFAAIIDSTGSAGSLFPQPSGMPAFYVGTLRVTQAYSGMLILSPIVVIALAVFLKRSRFGLAMRAASANPEAARMAGIFAGRMSSLAWALAGALSAFTAILIAPTLTYVGGDAFGPDLLLRSMTAAVIARMQSLPLALAGGVGIGVIEQLVGWNYPDSGIVEVALFIVILVALLTQRQRGGREEDKGSWAAVQALRPLPEEIRSLPAVRMLAPLSAMLLLGGLAALPAVISNGASLRLTEMMCFAMVGLSVGVLTGLGGQLTLGQFAIAAIGAVISFQVSRRIGDFPLAFAYAGLGAGLVSMIIGLPALRIRGLMLSVTTLGFALATSAWLLSQPWMLGSGGGRNPGVPTGWPFGHSLDSGHSYYYFSLVVFALVFLMVRNIRQTGFGRLLIAVRDNEDNARAFTVRANLVKLQGYLIAGFIAGIAGATYAHSLAEVGTSAFPVSSSIDVVVMAVLGGIATLVGPILGVLWIKGLPLLNVGNLALAGSYLGIVGVILWKPGGLVELFDPLRLRLVTALAQVHGVDARPLLAGKRSASAEAGATETAVRPLIVERIPHQRSMTLAATLLEARHLSKQFGGIVAVRDVSFAVRARETLGLIGPNGAGKTTTFELLGGFTQPDGGRVRFNRRDISGMGPEGRARLGLIRSFQDAALFPTMTVQETLMLALERSDPTRLRSSLIGWSPSDRAKRRRAGELVGAMGLGAYRDKQIRELSTGTRRITEIACLVALEPMCLLLDEPSSGIAQRESEALAELLTDLKTQLDLTLVVIEHDIPLIMGISDRIIAMADGAVIAEGTPDVVRNDPAVIDAYLGGKVEAIERSGRRRKAVSAT